MRHQGGIFTSSSEETVKFTCDGIMSLDNDNVNVTGYGCTVNNITSEDNITGKYLVGGKVRCMWCVAHSTADKFILPDTVNRETMTNNEMVMEKRTRRCMRATPLHTGNIRKGMRKGIGKRNRLGRDILGGPYVQKQLRLGEEDLLDELTGDI